MWEINRDQRVGNRSILNYVATYVNAVCVVAYALPPKHYGVAIINAVAVLAELFYSWFYRRHAQGRARTIANYALAGEVLWGVAVILVYFLGFYGGHHEELRVKLFGTMAAVTSGLMYLAMIPDTWGVFRTHNLQNQNILLLLAGIGNCASWTVYANEPRDYYIQVPNGAGSALTVIQTLVWGAIWVMYRNVAPNVPAAPQGNPPAAPQGNQLAIELPVVVP